MTIGVLTIIGLLLLVGIVAVMGLWGGENRD